MCSSRQEWSEACCIFNGGRAVGRCISPRTVPQYHSDAEDRHSCPLAELASWRAKSLLGWAREPAPLFARGTQRFDRDNACQISVRWRTATKSGNQARPVNLRGGAERGIHGHIRLWRMHTLNLKRLAGSAASHKREDHCHKDKRNYIPHSSPLSRAKPIPLRRTTPETGPRSRPISRGSLASPNGLSEFTFLDQVAILWRIFRRARQVSSPILCGADLLRRSQGLGEPPLARQRRCALSQRA